MKAKELLELAVEKYPGKAVSVESVLWHNPRRDMSNYGRFGLYVEDQTSLSADSVEQLASLLNTPVVVSQESAVMAEQEIDGAEVAQNG
jgi:hypothetical protein